MTTRAKFKVDKIELSKYGQQALVTVVASPVYGNDDPEHENTKFWKYTPTGQLTLGTVNAEAVEGFDPGREFYLDLTLVDEASK